MKYNVNKIRSRSSYTIADIVELFSITDKTVRRWVTDGLTPIMKNKRPLLFMGSELKRFVIVQREKQKCDLKPGEMYCLSCRGPSTPIETKIRRTGKTLGKNNVPQYQKLGVCSMCGTQMRQYTSTPPKQIV
jgi:hypothetical protein